MSLLPVKTREPEAATTQANELQTRRGSSALVRVQNSSSLIVPYLHYGTEKIGRLGILGTALCFFSLVVFLSSNKPMHEQLSVQQAELDQARIVAENERRFGRVETPQQQANSFVSELPSRTDVPVIMSSIVSVAAASGIALESGSYEYVATDSDSISRYQMSLPVSGSYSQVKAFIENSLAAVPSLALDSMRIERGSISDTQIAADLKFSILLGGAP